MSRIKWEKLRHAGKPREQADKKKPAKAKGGWSHIAREPVKTYTDAQIAEWAKSLGNY